MILLVDDRPENILPLKKILELHRFTVDTAQSGEEALRKVLKNNYSVIILDVQMPGMDGFEVASALGGFSKTKDTSIIFLSAVNTDKKFITKGYTTGGVDYLTKPVDPDILVLKVKMLQRLYEQQQELRATQDSLRQEIEVRKQAEKALAERMAKDIEAQKEANERLEQEVTQRTEELRQKNAELEQTNHELQQFTWVVSHDLKEPLRKIQLFNGIIKEEFLKGNDEAISYLERSIRSSVRMANLINDVLAYSQLAVPEPFQPTDLNNIVHELLIDFDSTITRLGASITVDPLPVIDTIPARIRQVFQNLISNALKFTRPNVTPVIQIRAERIDSLSFDAHPNPEGEFYRFIVQDNGIGFEERFLDRIFVIFQRLHKQTSYEGTGIGLAIAGKNIEKHRGLITARSRPNEGSQFIFVLPIEQLQPEVTATV